MIPEFKIRCSAIGQIMTNPKAKADKDAGNLSKTAKTYCETWLKEQIYKRRKTFVSKHTNKGNLVEQDSIDFIAKQLGYGMLMKNDKRYDNDFMTGEPDVVLKDVIIDAKSSWDPFSFPLFEDSVDTNYWWQGQGYMALTGVRSYKLIYCLMDTPDHLIASEARKIAFFDGYDVDEVYEELQTKMTYGDIDPENRIKIFDFEYDENAINQIFLKVYKCRDYINSLTK